MPRPSISLGLGICTRRKVNRWPGEGYESVFGLDVPYGSEPVNSVNV